MGHKKMMAYPQKKIEDWQKKKTKIDFTHYTVNNKRASFGSHNAGDINRKN